MEKTFKNNHLAPKEKVIYLYLKGDTLSGYIRSGDTTFGVEGPEVARGYIVMSLTKSMSFFEFFGVVPESKKGEKIKDDFKEVLEWSKQGHKWYPTVQVDHDFPLKRSFLSKFISKIKQFFKGIEVTKTLQSGYYSLDATRGVWCEKHQRYTKAFDGIERCPDCWSELAIPDPCPTCHKEHCQCYETHKELNE